MFGCLGTGERTWPSPQWIAYTGLSAGDSVGFGWLDAVHPDDRRATLEAWTQAPSSDEYVVEHRIRRAADAEYRWHQTRAAPLRDPPDRNLAWVGSSADVHETHRLRDRIAEAERQLRTMVEGVPQLLWRSSNMGHWTWSSPQWCDFTGQTQEQSHGRGWLDVVHPDDHDATMKAWVAAQPHGLLDVEFRVRRSSDGAFVWHRTRSTPVRDETGAIVEWLGTTTDVHDLKALQERQQALLDDLQRHTRELETEIRERERAEARLLYDARHDGLTGLHNRAFLMNRIRVALGRQPSARCAVLFLDLDRFKLVNDSLGHRTGDLLLIEVAARLKACVSANQTLARFGGDEFILLVEDVGDLDVVETLALEIMKALGSPMWLGEQEIFASCSIGIVYTAPDHVQAEDVLRDADIAMYHAKKNNSGGYAIFTEAMRNRAVEALDLRTDLRNAILRQEFILHYQPICSALTREVIGLEALVRWQHPRRGTVPPGEFIGVAEETGVIRDIGRWVLREACTQMRRWRSAFPSLTLCLNVNASGEELKGSGFATGIEEALAVNELDPRQLQLEITESIFLKQPDRIGEILNGIRGLGVKIALDDFGTGYSSLSYLDRFQVDAIKIDRSFVVGVPLRPKAVAIIEAMVRLGRTVGLDVVAEGVETDAQLQSLKALGCGIVQGYFLGRPAPANDISDILARQSASRAT